MNRRIAALALVVLVALSGCSGILGGSGTPTTVEPGSNTTTTTTDAPAFPPGIDDGELTNETALVEHHTDLLIEDGFVSSTTVVTESSENPTAPATNIDYRATVEPGGFPYLIDVNTTRDGTVVQERVIWSNESLRLERTRGLTRSGNRTTDYARLSGQPLAVDPGIKAFMQVFQAGDFEVVDVSGEGDDRRIALLATSAEDDGLAAAEANVTDYRGEVVLNGEGRIRRIDVSIDYVNRNGEALSSEVSYRIEETAEPAVSEPDWTAAALNGTSDITISATGVDDAYIEIRNTGGEPIPENYRLVVATNQGAGVLELNQSIAPGEAAYIYQPKGEGARLGFSEPTGDLEAIDGEFRIVVVNTENDEVTEVTVSV